MDKRVDHRANGSIRILVAVMAAVVLVNGCGIGEMRKRHRLFDACLTRDGEQVQALLDQGLDPNTEGYKGGRALPYAASSGDVRIVGLLLDHGARTDDNYAELALRDSISGGSVEVAERLLSSGVDPNANHYLGGTPLMDAAKRGHDELVQLLLERGADPNLPGKYDGSVAIERCEATALSVAAQNGHSQVAQLLVEYGAQVGYQDPFGCTAIAAAEESGHPEIAAQLRLARR